ncbi:hypothetical protein Z584_02538, partial [Mycobacterium tuberculosis variant bovis B2 7505]
ASTPRPFPAGGWWWSSATTASGHCGPGSCWNLTVRGHPRDLYRVYSGRSTLAAEISAERIELDGLPAMRRAFPSWMAWSPFAPAMRQAVVSVDQMPEAHGG